MITQYFVVLASVLTASPPKTEVTAPPPSVAPMPDSSLGRCIRINKMTKPHIPSKKIVNKTINNEVMT